MSSSTVGRMPTFIQFIFRRSFLATRFTPSEAEATLSSTRSNAWTCMSRIRLGPWWATNWTLAGLISVPVSWTRSVARRLNPEITRRNYTQIFSPFSENSDFWRRDGRWHRKWNLLPWEEGLASSFEPAEAPKSRPDTGDHDWHAQQKRIFPPLETNCLSNNSEFKICNKMLKGWKWCLIPLLPSHTDICWLATWIKYLGRIQCPGSKASPKWSLALKLVLKCLRTLSVIGIFTHSWPVNYLIQPGLNQMKGYSKKLSSSTNNWCFESNQTYYPRGEKGLNWDQTQDLQRSKQMCCPLLLLDCFGYISYIS